MMTISYPCPLDAWYDVSYTLWLWEMWLWIPQSKEIKKMDTASSFNTCMTHNLLWEMGLQVPLCFMQIPVCVSMDYMCTARTGSFREETTLCLWILMGLGARYALSPIKTKRLQCMCGAELEAPLWLPWCRGSYLVKTWWYEKDSLNLNTRFPPNPQCCSVCELGLCPS